MAAALSHPLEPRSAQQHSLAMFGALPSVGVEVVDNRMVIVLGVQRKASEHWAQAILSQWYSENIPAKMLNLHLVLRR